MPPNEVSVVGGKYVFANPTSDGRASEFTFKSDDWQKPPRPKGKIEFVYKFADGSICCKVIRNDEGDGSKKFSQIYRDPANGEWEQYEWKGKNRISNFDAERKKPLMVNVPLYRLPEVLKAIAAGKKIWFVEGEGKADSLVNLGLCATTLIAGAGKLNAYNPNALAVLKGAEVVLCPDRDIPGIKHTDEVEAALKNVAEIQWMYAALVDHKRLPKSGGFDVGDLIESMRRQGKNAEQIATELLGKVGAKSMSQTEASAVGSILRFPKKADQLNCEAIRSEIRNAVENGISGSQMTVFLKELQRSNSTWSFPDLDRLRTEIASEGDSIAEVDSALKSLSEALKGSNDIYDPRKEYPAGLADEIIRHSKAAYIDPIADCVYIDAHIGSSLGSRVVLAVAGRYPTAPDYFALVARSGTGKTEAKSATTKPLEDLGKKDRKRYITEREEYDSAMKLYEKQGGEVPPEKPAPCRKYVHKRGSSESLTKRLSELPPGAGLSWVRDELHGLFASLNRFNKDSDSRQQLIEMWDGGADEDDRVDSANALYIEDVAMSIVGNFQPRIAFETFKDPYDADGLRARFNIRLMQDVEPDFDVEPEEDISRSLRDCLSDLYAYLRTFDTNGKNDDGKYVVRMSNAAKDEYKRFRKKNYVDRTAVEQETSEEAFLNKGPAHVSRKILRLHCTECFFNPAKDRNLVTSGTVQRAVSWWSDCVRDFRILAGMSGAEDRLDKILLKIQEHAWV